MRIRYSLPHSGRNIAEQKRTRRAKWSLEELALLRRDEQRPWSEMTNRFLAQYPGRSPGAIQVYWSPKGKK